MTSSPRAVRRQPAQARSRARVEAVLDAASALIVERGLEPITMTDIADRAGMALTAVYRYFPNKQAVVRELALRVFEHDTDTLVGAPVADGTPLATFVRAGIDEFRRRHDDEPVRLPLRAAIHADAELSALDLDESRRNAATIATAVAALTGRDDHTALEQQALLFVELIDSLMRLVPRLEADEADALVEQFATMMTDTLAGPSGVGSQA